MIVGATSSYSLKFYCHILYVKDNGTAETVVTKATMLDLDTDDKMKYVIINFEVLSSVICKMDHKLVHQYFETVNTYV